MSEEPLKEIYKHFSQNFLSQFPKQEIFENFILLRSLDHGSVLEGYDNREIEEGLIMLKLTYLDRRYWWMDNSSPNRQVSNMIWEDMWESANENWRYYFLDSKFSSVTHPKLCWTPRSSIPLTIPFTLQTSQVILKSSIDEETFFVDHPRQLATEQLLLLYYLDDLQSKKKKTYEELCRYVNQLPIDDNSGVPWKCVGEAWIHYTFFGHDGSKILDFDLFANVLPLELKKYIWSYFSSNTFI